MAYIKEFEENVQEKIVVYANKFGCNIKKGDSQNAGFRKYWASRLYMAYITKGQEDNENSDSGAYSGISYVVFPVRYDKENEEYTCVVSIGVGTSDLGDDEELAQRPYIRRKFLKLTKGTEDVFFKNDFANVETDSDDLFDALKKIKDSNSEATDTSSKHEDEPEADPSKETETAEKESAEAPAVKCINEFDTVEKYKKLLPAACIVKFTADDVKNIDNKHKPNGFDVLIGWLAQYAEIRGWHCNFREGSEAKRKDFINNITKKEEYSQENDVKEVKKLLETRRYVVLQGAPGTGKTRLANLFADNRCEDLKFDEVLFEQFHAETTYADFVGGIQPVLGSSSGTQFEYREGKLTEAIKAALRKESEEKKEKKILLIIDEINRANLANVLGPVFYLFERTTSKRPAKVHIKIKDDNFDIAEKYKEIATFKDGCLELSQLPDNLYVIATMNTADRSIAVVDFALRRRFAWYTTMPYVPKEEDLDGNYFHEPAFNKIKELFEKYATDEELNIMPGQHYFIVNKDFATNIKDEIEKKIKEVEDKKAVLVKKKNKSKKEQEEIKEYNLSIKLLKEKQENEVIKDRMIYEIMPLMKEYFAESLIIKAQDEFANYYHEVTGLYMYR